MVRALHGEEREHNDTYHLAELDETRLAVLVARKWIKVFKKWFEDEPDPEGVDESDDDDRFGPDEESGSGE
jgi:hypothetical protein